MGCVWMEFGKGWILKCIYKSLIFFLILWFYQILFITIFSFTSCMCLNSSYKKRSTSLYLSRNNYVLLVWGCAGKEGGVSCNRIIKMACQTDTFFSKHMDL